jgi:hypothetical protein
MYMSVNKDDVLCPELYFKLKKLFKSVLVANRGVQMVTRVDSSGRETPVVSGEHYRVCCPWCNDTRHRLYINHRWFENRFMANCFNETACTKGDVGKSRLDQLHVWLFGTTARLSLPVKKVRVGEADAIENREFVTPLACVNLNSLPESHEAIQYLKSRGYNPSILEKYLGVGWITDQGIPILKERLYIPIYQAGKLMGYQARIIKADPDKSKQKYINPSGMRKSTLLYNIDNAVNQGALVVCEGPADVWSVGPAGVAIFGSDCSHSQLSTIGKFFNGKPIAVALDADASEKADNLVVKIQQVAPRSFVTKIKMAGDEDPGSLKKELWSRLHYNLESAGIKISSDYIMEWPDA